MKKKTLMAVIIVIVSLLILGLSIGASIYYHNNNPIKIDKDFSKINLEKITNIMFVAHPDDDAIWGGAHLLEDGDKYLVVCITCGVKRNRVLEFENVMNEVGSKFIMLGYPDKTRGKKDNWNTSRDKITEDISKILSLKNWNIIVTHNPDGEYGHIHHKMTNQIITSLANKDRLFYFGKYYKKSEIDDYKNELIEMDDDMYQKKDDILSLYKSQKFIYKMFGHMFKYENWLSYEEWYHEES